MKNTRPQELVPEASDEGRREFTVAMQLKIIGDLPRAIKRFGVSLEFYNHVVAEIHYQLGDCLFQQNDWGDAAQQFELALQHVPNHPLAQNRLASCRHLLERSARSEG